MNKNAQKKKEIDDIVVKYKASMFALRQKQDSIIAKFIEALEKKRLEEIRKSLQ